MVYFLCKASDSGRQNCYFALSLPVRGVWVEMLSLRDWCVDSNGSLPVRGVWVEIAISASSAWRSSVAPRAGSVG